MSNTVSTKKSTTIFLAAVLLVGTLAAISPSSFIIKGVNAQTEPYYEKDTRYDNYQDKYRMDEEYDKKSFRNNDYEPDYKHKEYNSYEQDYGIDKRYNSYELEYKDKNNYNNYEPEYPSKYKDDRKYNSYKPDHYGIDNNYDKKSYGSEQKYPSYGKDDRRDKSKDSSKSNNINKIKCINTNLNINGNNAGNVSIGNKGADKGYLGAYSSGGNGGYGGEGFSKQDKDFECIINNNNTNTNLVGGGNQTEPLTCEGCFTENLNQAQLNNITLALSVSRVGNLEGLCEQLSNATFTNTEKLVSLRALFDNASITDVDAILRVLACLEELRLIVVPPNFDPILD